MTASDKLTASFRNPKPYLSPLQNLAKQGTRQLSHLIGETNIDINKIKVETAPTMFCKYFTNMKTKSEDTKTLHIQFVNKQLNAMKDSTITDCIS